MEITDCNTETSPRVQQPNARCSNATVIRTVNLASRIAVPLVIGIFTIIIAIHQQNVAQSNRNKDVAQAAELRKQDIELARLQREEDRETARKQREEDRETARKQREEDKEIARLQRELDLRMANDKRSQEYELTERQLNLSKSQREHEFELTRQNRINDIVLEDQRQKENILVRYQRDLAALLLNYQHMLIESHVAIKFVLQMKTRAALNRLDPQRRTILIRSIMQAGILDNDWQGSTALLYKANVSGVDFSGSSTSDVSDYLFKYKNLYIEMADGRFAILRNLVVSQRLSFAFSNFDYADWSFSELNDIKFQAFTTMNEARFTGTKFKGISFDKLEMNRVSFQYNKYCVDCVFMETSVNGVRLDHSTFQSSVFFNLSMSDGNMSHSSFINTAFEDIKLDRVDLSGANFHNCKFTRISMVNCSMFKTVFKSTFFSKVNLTGCKGLTNEHISSLSGSSQVIFPKERSFKAIL